MLALAIGVRDFQITVDLGEQYVFELLKTTYT